MRRWRWRKLSPHWVLQDSKYTSGKEGKDANHSPSSLSTWEIYTGFLALTRHHCPSHLGSDYMQEGSAPERRDLDQRVQLIDLDSDLHSYSFQRDPQCGAAVMNRPRFSRLLVSLTLPSPSPSLIVHNALDTHRFVRHCHSSRCFRFPRF